MKLDYAKKKYFLKKYNKASGATKTNLLEIDKPSFFERSIVGGLIMALVVLLMLLAGDHNLTLIGL